MGKRELKLVNLEKRYGEKVVLHPVNLLVAPGSFLALLGPSGCGKTTLLRMIAGLEKASGGEIILGDQNLDHDDFHLPPEDRGFGMVFQSYAVWPHLTVFENVHYPLKVNRRWKSLTAREREARTLEALKLVHLDGLGSRYPHQLSGGQQQRVALARGLVMEPEILLLDEPLSNLDARLRAELRREIRELHRKLGMTIVYVTHDQREAFEMSTRVVVLDQGRVAQDGTPEAVRLQPAPGFVTEFLLLD